MSRFWLLTSGIVLTAAATGVTVAVAATGVAHDPTGVALARALTVALPCAAGLCAWLTGESARLGRLLLLTAALLFASTFAESADPATYTLGRAAGWVVEVLLVALVLAYPSGRLTGRADRLIVAAAGLTVAVGFVPGLFLSEHLPVPSPFTSCTADCPPSALFALDRPIGAVDATLRILGPTLLAVVTTAVTIRLWARAQNATPLARRMYLPVLAIAITWAALMGAAVVARAIAPSWIGLEVIAWCLALAVPAAAAAFLVGLVRWRLFTAHAILRLTRCLPAADAASLERAFALAFDDPQLRLVYPAVDGEADGWCDAAGFDVTAPLPGGPRTLTPVSDGTRIVVGIVHDSALLHEPELIRAGAAVAGTALSSRRLAAQIRSATQEIHRSRMRIAASADRERRRIERDLHDGAQQRLIALRIELELAEAMIGTDPGRGVTRLRELEHELDEAIDDLRALAHGIHPPALTAGGLEVALRDAVARSAFPVVIVAEGVGRYAPEVESAVYFSVLEALQNVHKHAAGVTHVGLVLCDIGGELEFFLRDNGCGATDIDAVAGHGMANMRDRLASAGGRLDVRSVRGRGTVVYANVPVARRAPQPASPA